MNFQEKAIARAQYGRRSVVLIDEIDKADLDFPNDLLWELDRLEFRVTEAPEIYYAVGNNPALRPIVFVTHNEEKTLPTAFLRRCIFHYIEFPQTQEDLQQVLATHQISNQELSKKAIEVLLQLRKLDLTNWKDNTAAQIARHMPMFPLNREGIQQAVNVLRGQQYIIEKPL